MKNKKEKLFRKITTILLFSSLFCSLAAFPGAVDQQQKKRLTGTVTDESGIPIIGANVVETGTTNGAITDIDGHFGIDVASNATIRITYIGYLEQNINSAGLTKIDIKLVEDTKSLEEVVEVG